MKRTEPWVADYSWARPHPEDLHDYGCIGVVRYIGPGNRGRDISREEMRRLHDHGLGVGLVWETTTTAALAGWQAGAFDFEAANRWADSIDFPAHLPVFYAVDTDVTPAQVRGPIADTFHGALSRSSLRPCRPYGEADVLDILIGELELMDCGWQCYAWSRGRRSEHRCMFQNYPPIMDMTVDVNELGPMPCDFLWHPTIGFHEAAPTTSKDWLDMATVDELRAVIAGQLGWHLIMDARPDTMSCWLLNIDRMQKRWLPNHPSDYPAMLKNAIATGALLEMTDLGMVGAGHHYLALLDLADLVGPAPA